MEKLHKMYKFLKKQKNSKILFITTSYKWEKTKETRKSTMIAGELKNRLENCEILDASILKIYPCQGNVSNREGNHCGVKDALLKNKEKNPNNFIRCWAALNDVDDQMYIVANKIYEADIIIFFGPTRWGKMNAIYTNLMERLTWLENRHNTLKESNLLKDKMAGIVSVGHNWNVENSIELEKQVLKFFGFKVPNELSFGWQWTEDKNDESQKGYKKDFGDFMKEFNFYDILKETVILFKDYFNK